MLFSTRTLASIFAVIVVAAGALAPAPRVRRAGRARDIDTGVVPLDLFVKARLDEDALMAQAAAGAGRWTALADTGMGEWYVESTATGAILSTGYVTESHAGPHAEHIARHDPDRVLADVSARRQVLAEYQRSAGARRDALELAIKTIAATHAGHPDYSPMWGLDQPA